MYIYIYIYTSTHRGKRHKVAGTKRRDDRFSFLLDRSPHCWSSRLDRCEFKAFHAITHIGQFAYGICLSTHWTVNRMTYSAIRRHVIIHRGTCFFLPISLARINVSTTYPSRRVSNRSFEIKRKIKLYTNVFPNISLETRSCRTIIRKSRNKFRIFREYPREKLRKIDNYNSPNYSK